MEAVRFITGLWRTRMTDNIGLNLITLFIIHLKYNLNNAEV